MTSSLFEKYTLKRKLNIFFKSIFIFAEYTFSKNVLFLLSLTQLISLNDNNYFENSITLLTFSRKVTQVFRIILRLFFDFFFFLWITYRSITCGNIYVNIAS